MSLADYERVAADYDAERRPAGLGFVREALGRCSKPLGAQRVLDAGCGTGNYAHALSGEVGKVHGIDLSKGMLRRAQEKLPGGALLVQGSVCALPYRGDSFDAVLCHFVLHHLDPGEDFADLRRALAEFARVLRPGGVLCLQTASHDQIRDGYWWAALVTEAVVRAQARYLPLGALEAALRELGFRETRARLLVDEVLQGAGYLNPRGPLSEAYRNADSTWSLATSSELERAQDQTRRLLESGAMSEFLSERERARSREGQATFLSLVLGTEQGRVPRR
jgi:ubiquinone/menaquinone biosynthesis C-methylase UbiE